MPYDKGDFTQQGINGDVSTLVRLNEKRVMKVVLSSDDESDNCDISGKVYDLLNGTSYDIGSGGGGGGATAKTLPVTITNNSSNSVFIEVPYWLDTGYLVGGIDIPANDTTTIDANIFYVDSDEFYDLFLDGTGLSAQDAQFDTVNSTSSYATLDFDGDSCEIVLTSPPNPDATATLYIIDIE